jgi:hypothetical protein
MIIKSITTRIESIARSAARRPPYAPAHPQLFRSYLTTTRGGDIAAVCFRLRSPPDLYFATHSRVEVRRTFGCGVVAAFNRALKSLSTPFLDPSQPQDGGCLPSSRHVTIPLCSGQRSVDATYAAFFDFGGC